MRIVWKDSLAYKTSNYKGVETRRHDEGWTVNIPGDDTIYETRYRVKSAIDKYIKNTKKKSRC